MLADLEFFRTVAVLRQNVTDTKELQLYKYAIVYILFLLVTDLFTNIKITTVYRGKKNYLFTHLSSVFFFFFKHINL